MLSISNRLAIRRSKSVFIITTVATAKSNFKNDINSNVSGDTKVE